MIDTIIITDTHFGVYNASEYFIQKQITFLNNLKRFIIDNNIKNLIHLGDVFDNRKTIDIRTLNFVMKYFITMLKELNLNVFILVGNHDTVYKNSIELNTVRELMGWCGFHIIDKPEDVTINNSSFCMIPWICESNKNECIEFIQRSNSAFCLGHFDIAGFKISKSGNVSKHGLKTTLFKKFYHTLSGHFHAYSSDNGITYIGSPYMLSFNDVDDVRRFVLFDSTTGGWSVCSDLFEPYYYVISKWNKDIDVQQYKNAIVKVVIDSTANKYEFDLWYKKLNEVAYKTSIIESEVYNSHIQDIDTIEVKKDTLTFLYEYADFIYKDDKDLNVIKTTLQEVYREAQIDNA